MESDQATKRPSWYALQSLIDLLEDARWNPETLRWEGGRGFEPVTLPLAFENAPPSVRHLLLQKESGDWFLLLWNEARNFQDGRDLFRKPVPLRLRKRAPGGPARAPGGRFCSHRSEPGPA